MEFYHIVKGVHMLTAYITAVLMLLRLGLGALGRPQWRGTPLRWIPHLNDTVLLSAALGLMVITGWLPSTPAYTRTPPSSLPSRPWRAPRRCALGATRPPISCVAT